MTAVSVIVCAYTETRWNGLYAAVEALRIQTLPPAEIIVVIDHNEALLDRLRRELPAVCAQPNRARAGLSGARNTGVAIASSPIVAFLDDDAVPAPDWLARLVAPYGAPDVIATGGRCDPVWVAGRPRWFPDEFDWVVGSSYRGLPETTSEVRNPIGASMSFRSSALAAAGPFREDMGRVGPTPLGCEETELAIRMRERIPGSRILYVPGAEVAHLVPAERANISYFLRRCHAEGISKALVARVAGAGRALASERHYASRTLPAGALKGVRDALGGDAFGLLRTGSIVAGLIASATGYLSGTVRRRRRTSPAFEPTWVTEADIADGMHPLIAPARHDRPYVRVRCLVRRNGVPLATVELPLRDGRLDSDRLLEALPAASGHDETPAGAVRRRSMSVVVCTHERPSSLAVALNSILRCRPAPTEIIVVDSAPRTEATERVVEALAAASVRLVREPCGGLSRARNLGAAEAIGELIAFTDDDVRVDTCWLGALAEGFERAEHVACVTGAVPAAELETPAQLYFDRKVGWNGAPEPRVYDLQDHRVDSPLYPYLPGTFGAGANFAATAAVLAAVGPFDQALGAGSPAGGGEDLDFFLRVLRTGMAIAHEPSALVWHFHRQDLRELRRQMVSYGAGLSALACKELLSPQTACGALRRIRPAISRLRRTATRGGAVGGGMALRAAEIWGLLLGPLRYARGRLMVSR
jgi:glycosyltransferase involved in cell wall biosynthesis